ncbi:alcohol dehydrogenase transcription factor Myb/SANT-like family protein [Actinidia rufa]|uniref:Alcohol dehydrogenase transcription factor Myb/SANT-like family protein n=1 Tax=Actinidia rufa TaxID=165716 RepID=A0A7J0GLY8_9ERIC|nr:alcohol dehydrogenase transcription factor Myb/SANT-like family protein [Actinidia rufa]
MDNTEDDAKYPANPYGVTQGYGSSQRPKLPVQSSSYPQQIGDQYVDDHDGDDEEDEEEVDEEEDDNNGNRQIVKVENDDDDIVDDDDSDDENEDEDEDQQNGYSRRIGDDDLERHQKKRKLKSLLSSYEFAPRMAPSQVVDASASKPSSGRRNSLADWTEHETFVLLDAWGDRFLKRGRKSLRSEEWQEVSEKVTQESKSERTDTQCRNRLDTLKKKYKKEKLKLDESKGMTSKWLYFSKMDMLMSSSPKQPGLSCGVDSGEYVFMNPKVYLNRSNGLDEMRDSPGNSESAKGEKDDSDGLPPKRSRMGRDRDDGASFRLLADSIEKFSELYEKTENSKRQQMLELEKMRMDFHRELELHKRQILERAQAEIAKIRQGDNEENDLSAENVSG